MIVETPERPSRRSIQQKESRLQGECFTWAWNERPITRRLLFHVTNEDANSNKIEGARKKAMGLIAGVSDLILLIPRGKWHGLMIEMKTEIGYQRPEQKEWQKLVESQGYRYEVVRSKDAFMALIDSYLAEK